MTSSILPPGAERLLELFHQALAGVSFPGIDAAVLDATAAGVQAAAREVERCAAALEAAHAALAAAQAELHAKGQRALAYARVYAEDAPDLIAELDAIALARGGAPAEAEPPAAPTAARRRGRPRAESPALFAPPE